MSTTMVPGSKGVIKEGAFIPRINLDDFFITVEGKKLTALDIAEEAVQLQESMARIVQGERDFSTHMLMLASKCATADDFSILCENVSFDMNWGRANPAPKTWVVYRSTIYKAWKDFGVKPLAELEVPQVKAGRLLKDAEDEPIRQRMIVSGINQIKKATTALKLERSEEEHDEGDTVEERRNPVRVLVDRFSKAKEGVDKEASDVFQSLIFSYVNMDQVQKGRMIRALKRIAADFKVEPTSTH